MCAETKRESVVVVGCGYIGSALGKALVEAGHTVVGTTTTPARLNELISLGIRAELVDVQDVARLQAIMVGGRAAYLTIAPRRRGEDYQKVYLAGVRNLLAAANGTTVTRLIYTSSTRVYGQDDGSWVDEHSPTEPRDANGKILLEAERMLLGGAKAGGLMDASGCGAAVRATVVRLSGIYGPGREVADRVRGAAGTQRDDGDVYVNLIHRDDIVAALVALLDVPHHGVLNLSDDRPTTRREWYDRVLREAGLPAVQWITPCSPRNCGKRVANSHIKELLGLTFRHPTH